MSFFIGDEKILAHSKLSPTDKMVYFGLVTFYNRQTKICYPRVSTLAARLGLTKQTVYRSIARLKKRGIIKTKRRQSTLEYTLPLQANLLTETRVINFDKSELSKMTSINKTKLINQYSFNKSNFYKRNNFDRPFLPGPSKNIIENGLKLKFVGSEGLIDHFEGEDGNAYEKNRMTGELKKKLKILDERLYLKTC